MTGKKPELWHPDTGKIETADYRIEGGRTIVALRMEPEGSVFIVFRKPSQLMSHISVQGDDARTRHTGRGWQLRFPENWGAPSHVQFDQLASWTESSDPGVKYFSGTATYSKSLNVPAAWLKPGARILLDLGTVKEMAQLSINGVPVNEILWKPPFEADITRMLKPGANQIDVKVTNLWPNRMIGDLQPGVRKTYTFTDFHAFTKDSLLMESGLLGPVKILEQSARFK